MSTPRTSPCSLASSGMRGTKERVLTGPLPVRLGDTSAQALQFCSEAQLDFRRRLQEELASEGV